MLFKFRIMNRTVKELRKNQGLTAKELAQMIKLDAVDILKVDDMKLKEVAEPLRSRLFLVLSGRHVDKAPWL